MNYICEYDEAYTKSDAEDIGFCGRCRIPACENSMVSNKTDLKKEIDCCLSKRTWYWKRQTKENKKSCGKTFIAIKCCF